jgi:hypothetical protein
VKGFWTDHWTYLLDLIESHLAIYPESERQSLYLQEIPFYMSPAVIKRRSDRYSMVQSSFSLDSQETQYEYRDIDLRSSSTSVLVENDTAVTSYRLPTDITLQIVSAVCNDESGPSTSGDKDILKSTGEPCYPNDRRVAMSQSPHWQLDLNTREVSKVSVVGKLFLLGVIKFSSLDPYGMGVEMEGGKPGWNDAMNGLPGLFGSGMVETYETVRLFEFLQRSLGRMTSLTDSCSLKLPIELSEFYLSLLNLTRHWNKISLNSSCTSLALSVSRPNLSSLPLCQSLYYQFWNESNTLREEYLQRVAYSGTFQGDKISHSCQDLHEQLSDLIDKLEDGIQRSLLLTQTRPEEKKGEERGVVPPTYFYYTVRSIQYLPTISNSSLLSYLPTEFDQHSLPLFLEGPVRMMKIRHSSEEKRAIYHAVTFITLSLSLSLD